MNAETVKLTGRDLLWYDHSAPAPLPVKARSAWKRHALVVLALIALKLAVLASGDGVEMLTTWANDSRGLLGWP